MPGAYLTRAEADAQRDGLDGHIYQGDLFQTVTFMIPQPDGSWEDRQWDAITLSHDCEYTKIAEKPDRPLLIAPVRSMADFYPSRDAILAGRSYGHWALPRESPVDDDEYVVDFRFLQPIAVRILQEGDHWTCMAEESRVELATRVELFLFRGRLGAP
jgi:hypothetical protein